VGVVRGGTSVNAIAETASMLIDLRSEDAAALQQLEAAVQEACRRGLPDRIAVEVEIVGDRPMGQIAEDHPLVRLVLDTGRAFDLPMRCVASSTDANLPLSLAIPALSVGIKRGGGAHTLREYLRVDSVVPGFRFGAAVLLGFSRWVEQIAAAPPPGEPDPGHR
ncbi:MAG TPA: peptidase dimerization domain-containing protein, partial [Bacillota bacterium]